MNLRTSVCDGILPFETALVDFFSLKMAHSATKRALSGKYILHYIYFYNYSDSQDAYSNTEEWLRHSIFTDEYINERISSDHSIEDTELLYYIIHLENKLPKNLEPKLSNLIRKNTDSTVGQPPEIRNMIFHIDLQKLSQHYTCLYQRQAEWNAELSEQLSCYVQSILDTDSRIDGVCQEYCSQIFEQLAWITVYTLADRDCFDQYENAYRIALQQKNRATRTEPVSQPDNSRHTIDTGRSDADIRQLKNRIADTYRRVSFYNRIAFYTLFVLLLLQIICMVIPISVWTQQDTSNEKRTLFYIIMLSVSTILLLLRFIPFYLAKTTSKLKVILDHFDQDPYFQKYAQIENLNIAAITYDTFKDTCHFHTELEKNRMVLNIGVTISIIFFFILSFLLQSFPLIVAGVSGTMVVYICIDVSIMNHRYGEYYNKLDTRTVDPDTNPMYSGFAKLLSWDYDMEQRHFIHRDMSRLNQHTADCIRYIFLAFVDRLRNSWTVIIVITLLLNISMLIAGVVEYMLPFNTYFRIPTPEYYAAFALALIIIMGIINITILLKTNEHYEKITLFQYLPGAEYRNDDEIIQVYHHYYNNRTITNLDIDRGVYKYNCSYMEQGKRITDILPEDDRMIFFFRQYSRISRVTIIIWTLCLCFLCIVVWHCHILWGLLIIPLAAVCNVLLVVWILPYLDARRIGTVIEKNHLAEGDASQSLSTDVPYQYTEY